MPSRTASPLGNHTPSSSSTKETPPFQDDDQASETTALLPGPSSASLPSSESFPTLSSSFRISHKRFRLSVPSPRTALLTLLVLLLVATGVIIPLIYFVYIPHRLRDALSGNNSDLKEFRILSVNPDKSIDVRVRAVAHNEDVPPVQVTMQPTLFSFLHIGQQQKDVKEQQEHKKKRPHRDGDNSGSGSAPARRRKTSLSTVVGSMQFPGLVIPKGSVDVPFEFESTVAHLDVAYIKSFVRDLMGGSSGGGGGGGGGEQAPAPPQVFRMQASPMMSLQRVGSWVVPMENNFVFDKEIVSAPNASLFNTTVVSYNVTYSLPLRIFANVTFNNPTPFSFAAQNMSLLFSIYYESSRILDMVIPPSTNLRLGVNTNATISGTSVPSGMTALMKLIGEYAESKPSILNMKDFSLEAQDENQAPIPWMNDVLKEVDFEVEVPGATEDEGDKDDGSILGSSTLLRYVGKAARARERVERAAGLVRRVFQNVVPPTPRRMGRRTVAVAGR
ncbi:hypothetical protein BDZ88DRAFT_504742 [Geranomyces variabilis]|nr:hypothetical protein BDZ88DRAFT_504742 [Geranomyces variabilis]KAJ3142127.1 hypothetical protein HDU90_004400 [Geranomyces variabilis]